MSASRKDVGAAVGRMIFHGQSSKGMARQLRAVEPEKLKTAMQRHGLGDVSVEKMTEVLAGKDRAGWSQAKVKKAVQALQDVHVASGHQGASKMVLTASRQVQETSPKMSPEERKLFMQKLARERRSDANKEVEGGSTMGVLDQMRGAMGRANKEGASGAVVKDGSASPAGDIRELRNEMRQQMHLAPKMVIPKTDPSEESGSSFNA